MSGWLELPIDTLDDEWIEYTVRMNDEIDKYIDRRQAAKMSDLPSFIDTPATAKMQTNNLCLNNPPLRWHADKTVPCLGEVWVFGSNLAGRHGAGAAAVARKKFGAVYGLGVGYQGLESAHCYAIPTKGEQLQTLPLDAILYAVDEFLDFAHRMERFHFFVTRIGCGLAGHLFGAEMDTVTSKRIDPGSNWRPNRRVIQEIVALSPLETWRN